MPSSPYQPALDRGGQRPDVVLRREAGLWKAYADRVAKGRSGVDLETLSAALRGSDVVSLNCACFLAGRCATPDGRDEEVLDGLLRAVLDGIDVDRLSSRAAAFVEAAMSRTLLDPASEGADRLRQVAADGGRGSTRDYLAAAYLAQLGDPSGWLAMSRSLRSRTAHTRLMAARYLASFAHLDGTVVDGTAVDTRGRLLDALDDPDPDVAREVPGLLAELEVDGLPDLLRAVVRSDRPDTVREAAKAILEET